MPTLELKVNGRSQNVEAESDMPLLWVIRDLIGMTGTKYSCGTAICGACTVLLDGQPIRSCSTPVSVAVGRNVTTIEGLDSDVGKAVQAAWRELNVPQCGYCQSGQILATTALLTAKPKPSFSEIDQALAANLCRCGSYGDIRKAVVKASEALTKA